MHAALLRRATAATVNPQKIPFVASEPLTQAAKLEKTRRAIVYPKYEYLGGTGSNRDSLPLTPTIPVAAL